MRDADDFQSGIDDLLDFGLTKDQAESVMHWHYVIVVAREQTSGGVAIVRLLSYMLDATSRANLQLRLTGMAFGTGLGHLTGHADMSQAAAALGVTHQAVEYAAKQAARAMVG
jgi:hypothetical protein